MKRTLLTVCLSVSAADLMAQESDFYLGFGLSLADVSRSLEDNASSGLSVVEGARLKVSENIRYEFEDDTSLSYRAFAGWTLNENLSFEVSLSDFGKTDVNQQTRKEFSTGEFSTESDDFEITTRAVTLSALLSYPMSDRVSLYTAVGGAWSEQEKQYTSEGFDLQIVDGSVRSLTPVSYNVTEKDRHLDFTYGLGVAIKINEYFESRAGVTGVELNHGRIIDYGLSLVYRI